MDKFVTVAVDAMGGDNAPGEIIKGCVEAIKELPVSIKLVGREDEVKAELSKYQYDKERIVVVNATEVISTDEVPTTAIRRKKDSSMVVGLNLVKNGEAEAFVSAGSTGALLTGATLIIGRIQGVERPALGTKVPCLNGYYFLIDAGANVDCKAKYLEQFGKMGYVYSKYVLGVYNPKVCIANIGVEEEKGNALTKEAYELLKESDVNFGGNVEMRDIPLGEADVVVADGFVGNTILKMTEGAAIALLKMVKGEITKGAYKIPALMLKTPFKNLKNSFDSEEVGGAPFLGLKSLVVKAHGSSHAKAIKNAIGQCVLFVENDIVTKIEEKL